MVGQKHVDSHIGQKDPYHQKIGILSEGQNPLGMFVFLRNLDLKFQLADGEEG